jgi:hypothetical protein
MAGATGVPTGLSPTGGVDYTIPLPYDVPSISSNRVAYYFAASTVGDAYRKAVAGSAESYAWIQAAATIDDTRFAASFGEVTAAQGGPLTKAMMQGWFRAALAALDSPGGSAFQGTITVTPEGAATISGTPKASPTPTTPSPDVMLNTTKSVAAQLADAQPITDTGLPLAMAPAPNGLVAMSNGLPTWVKWAAAIAGLLIVVSLFRKAS